MCNMADIKVGCRFASSIELRLMHEIRMSTFLNSSGIGLQRKQVYNFEC